MVLLQRKLQIFQGSNISREGGGGPAFTGGGGGGGGGGGCWAPYPLSIRTWTGSEK